MAALRSGHADPYLTTFRLCQEFGWTPAQVNAQQAVDIETFIAILDELQRLSTLVSGEEDTTTIVITDD